MSIILCVSFSLIEEIINNLFNQAEHVWTLLRIIEFLLCFSEVFLNQLLKLTLLKDSLIKKF